jgi:hypothetical protein
MTTFSALLSRVRLTRTRFDLPNMIKYADWINLMSYDLHGVWDRNNPIGSIVQGHTNLTEIKLAVELFWRVNIPPSRVSRTSKGETLSYEGH